MASVQPNRRLYQRLSKDPDRPSDTCAPVRSFETPEIKRVGDLEIAVDIKTQRRHWMFQMFDLAVMALIAMAGLLGLVGGAGPSSRAAAGDQDASLSVAE
jgi:hypothetical protein